MKKYVRQWGAGAMCRSEQTYSGLVLKKTQSQEETAGTAEGAMSGGRASCLHHKANRLDERGGGVS